MMSVYLKMCIFCWLEHGKWFSLIETQCDWMYNWLIITYWSQEYIAPSTIRPMCNTYTVTLAHVMQSCPII